MTKLILPLVVFFLAISMSLVNNISAEGPHEIDEWLQNLHAAKEKVTRLHFYFHDTLSGKNPTSIRIAQAPITNKSPTFFGLVNMIDDRLTEGPEPTSKLVGRAQGTYGSADLEELGLLMTFNFVFSAGEYNGSTLSVLGRNPVFHSQREMPVAGGTGVFRLARGVVTANTFSFNPTTGDAIVEYNVIAIHY